MDLENLLTLKEVASLLRLSPQTVYKLLREGSLPAVKIGNQWRFDPEQVRSWIRAQAERPSGNSSAAG